MKQVLSYKNNTDIPMMTALGEQVTYVFRIHLVQQVVVLYVHIQVCMDVHIQVCMYQHILFHFLFLMC